MVKPVHESESRRRSLHDDRGVLLLVRRGCRRRVCGRPREPSNYVNTCDNVMHYTSNTILLILYYTILYYTILYYTILYCSTNTRDAVRYPSHVMRKLWSRGMQAQHATCHVAEMHTVRGHACMRTSVSARVPVYLCVCVSVHMCMSLSVTVFVPYVDTRQTLLSVRSPGICGSDCMSKWGICGRLAPRRCCYDQPSPLECFQPQTPTTRHHFVRNSLVRCQLYIISMAHASTCSHSNMPVHSPPDITVLLICTHVSARMSLSLRSYHSRAIIPS